MNLFFPILIYEKDDKSIYLCFTMSEVYSIAEIYDVEDNVYLFYDAKGFLLQTNIDSNRKFSLSYKYPKSKDVDTLISYIKQYIHIYIPEDEEKNKLIDFIINLENGG